MCIRGVAVGSSIGHAIGGFFGGGSSAPAQQDDGAVAASSQNQDQNSWGPRSCEVDAKQFTKCLDDNQGNMQICNWYLEQLVRIFHQF
jgi:coiled-coil-helix-coiled-coil-helix domain-containing protein 2